LRKIRRRLGLTMRGKFPHPEAINRKRPLSGKCGRFVPDFTNCVECEKLYTAVGQRQSVSRVAEHESRSGRLFFGPVGLANRAGDAGENCVGIRANQPDCSDYDQQNYSHHYSVLCNVLAILGPESQKSSVHRSAFRCKTV
jgi:hypothetical protein